MPSLSVNSKHLLSIGVCLLVFDTLLHFTSFVHSGSNIAIVTTSRISVLVQKLKFNPYERKPVGSAPDMSPAIRDTAPFEICSAGISDSDDHSSVRMNLEDRKMSNKRPKSFDSQAELFSWIDRSRRGPLERVRTLSLHLVDVDHGALLKQPTSSQRTYPTAWSLYKADLERLENALRAMPNISSLTIFPPRSDHSMLKAFYHSFLDNIHIRCPKLRKLKLHDSKDLLKHAPALDKIQKVTFVDPASKSDGASEQTEASSQAGTSSSPRVDVVDTEKRTASSPVTSAIPDKKSRARTSSSVRAR